MGFDVNLLLQYAPYLIAGLWKTIWICFFAAILGIVVGLCAALGLLSSMRIVRIFCRCYVEIMRGIPILIILFLLYYGVPSFFGEEFAFSAEAVGVLGLGFYVGGYFAEIFRSGFQSIPFGQIEAARMLGIAWGQIIYRIKIPQMLTLIIPSCSNQLIILLKESALLSIITVDELTKNTTQMVNETFATFEPYLAAAVLYWIAIEGIAKCGIWIERKVKHG